MSSYILPRVFSGLSERRIWRQQGPSRRGLLVILLPPRPERVFSAGEEGCHKPASAASLCPAMRPTLEGEVSNRSSCGHVLIGSLSLQRAVDTQIDIFAVLLDAVDLIDVGRVI